MPPFKENAISVAMRELEEASIAQDLTAEKVSGLREGLIDGRALDRTSGILTVSFSPAEEYESNLLPISDPSEIAALAEELGEASHVLEQYRHSLERDLERRGGFINMLTECIVQQENTMNETTNLLQDCLQKLAQVEELRNQIKVIRLTIFLCLSL